MSDSMKEKRFKVEYQRSFVLPCECCSDWEWETEECETLQEAYDQTDYPNSFKIWEDGKLILQG